MNKIEKLMTTIGKILIVFGFYQFIIGAFDDSAIRGAMRWTICSGFLVSGTIFIVGDVIKKTIKDCFGESKQKEIKEKDNKLTEKKEAN